MGWKPEADAERRSPRHLGDWNDKNLRHKQDDQKWVTYARAVNIHNYLTVQRGAEEVETEAGNGVTPKSQLPIVSNQVTLDRVVETRRQRYSLRFLYQRNEYGDYMKLINYSVDYRASGIEVKTLLHLGPDSSES